MRLVIQRRVRGHVCVDMCVDMCAGVYGESVAMCCRLWNMSIGMDAGAHVRARACVCVFVRANVVARQMLVHMHAVCSITSGARTIHEVGARMPAHMPAHTSAHVCAHACTHVRTHVSIRARTHPIWP